MTSTDYSFHYTINHIFAVQKKPATTCLSISIAAVLTLMWRAYNQVVTARLFCVFLLCPASEDSGKKQVSASLCQNKANCRPFGKSECFGHMGDA